MDVSDIKLLQTIYYILASSISIHKRSNLADYLNESGFVSRSGRAFRDDTLRSMLENPIYIGIIEYQGTKKETYLTYKGKHQPLISNELLNKVAEVRAEKEKSRGHARYQNGDVKERYILQNLICYESCGRKLRVYTTQCGNKIYDFHYKDYSPEIEGWNARIQVNQYLLRNTRETGTVSLQDCPQLWRDFLEHSHISD